ncbi:membrane protein [Hylemonella gracilis str. Niagara R]|uniref:Membrane protein n=1 Tax=Hylemonella gracilis str. Niagara R TaxID=1458275 RepID=A0A016XER1_9BURK|nr:MFS transporter [Hylemonella gracilis]EYC50027.1 membrane protein [Hylemonella gracilis str. Niagara R]
MTATERRSSFSLAGIFALRMLGLFLVLPVFALEAQRYPGGEDVALVGLAMGIYGLTQALLQLPYGLASDRYGRKRVIVLGLLVFALGSLVAALADHLLGLLVGRALQGAGAVSAAVSALLADQTRDAVRTKAMALVGASIGLMFALSLLLAPVLTAWIGLSGLFWFTALLALGGVAVVIWVVPPEAPVAVSGEHAPAGESAPASLRAGLREVLRHPGLLRLDAGVFLLHAVQLAMWMAVPALLVRAGLVAAHHWWVYLPAVLASFFVMMATLFPLEKRGYLRAVFLAAIGLIGLAQLGLLAAVVVLPEAAHVTGADNWRGLLGVLLLGLLLFVFFCGFNVLEATQPSLVSRIAPAHARGTALGVYNAVQSLGLFVGGAAGGWLAQQGGPSTLFLACAGAMVLWLWVAWPMQTPGRGDAGSR